MSLDLRLLEILETRKRVDLTNDPTPGAPAGGGDPPRAGPWEPRVEALEVSVRSIDKTLAVISEQLKHLASRDDVHGLETEMNRRFAKVDTEMATLSGKLDTKASATDLAELKGRVARIPTVPVLTSILVFVSLLFAAATWVVRHLPPAWANALQ